MFILSFKGNAEVLLQAWKVVLEVVLSKHDSFATGTKLQGRSPHAPGSPTYVVLAGLGMLQPDMCLTAFHRRYLLSRFREVSLVGMQKSTSIFTFSGPSQSGEEQIAEAICSPHAAVIVPLS